MDNILHKIQKMQLTKVDAKIADYFSHNLSSVGVQTSTMLADKIGVSDTSLIRFIRKLGFHGYAEFRNVMSNKLAEDYSQVQQKNLTLGEKFANTREKLNVSNLLPDVSERILNNFQNTFSQLDEETVIKTANILQHAKVKYIAGFRGSSSIAIYLGQRLSLLVPHVVMLTEGDASAIEKIVDITSKDCLIVFSFPLHSEINKVIMDIAKRKGAKVILVTNSYSSPLARMASNVLTAQVDGLGFTNSYIAPMCLSELLVLVVSKLSQGKEIERLKEIDHYINQEKLY